MGSGTVDSAGNVAELEEVVVSRPPVKAWKAFGKKLFGHKSQSEAGSSSSRKQPTVLKTSESIIIIEDDGETSDEAVSETSKQPAPAQKKGPGRPPKNRANMTKAAQKPRDLPIFVWSEEHQQWMRPSICGLWDDVEHTMRAQCNHMKDGTKSGNIQSLYRRAIERGMDEIQHEKHSCFGCQVLSHSRRLCSNKDSNTTACQECVRLGRPCGQLIVNPEIASGEEYAVGFLPLPAEERENVGVTYLAHWDSQPKSRGTRSPAKAGGKGKEIVR
ncbi:hypothetical protein N0V95_009432 [Ascochyta clinopodiicola]|nr:hypothetical protein N0V95_009432 [Ascochyta clinopodiicola]